MQLYFRLLKFLFHYWAQLALAIFFMITLALSNGAMAYLIGPVLKFLFTNNADDTIRLIPIDLFTFNRAQMLIAVPLIIIFVALIKGLSFFWQAYFMGHVGQKMVADIRLHLYRHILNLPISYFSKSSTGQLISRMTNDVGMLQNTASNSVATILRESFSIIVLATVVITRDWKLALAAFVTFPLAIYPLVRFSKKMRKVSTQGQATMGAMTILMHEAIAGIRIVKAFCMEKYEEMRFGKENDRFTKFSMKSIKVRSISSPLMETLRAIGLAFAIWYAAYRIQNGSLTPDDFISFSAALLMLYPSIKALNGVNMNIQQGLAAAARVFELLDAPQETKDKDDAKRIDTIRQGIEFKDVSFRYGEKLILEGINLKVRKGEIIAIVGTSGAGKTTFINLLPRFYDVTEGIILFDDVDIRDIIKNSLRSQIAIVSQQVILFNDSVSKNIAYGDVTRDSRDIISAAKAANADSFIRKLPQGYDTVIGEGGVRLSGGERQRLSIARAILKNAPILILDEATSSLDTESEMEVQKGLNNLVHGRTTFVVAHRLSTVRNADRIIVLSDGGIKEMGRHEELLKFGGEYSRIYNMQFQGGDEINLKSQITNYK
ncbi:MAG: ATP-binding cassette domain-containing protein [Deltaproteobacteria bacterium]|nr:ATP-binding cassette domain-containing protein [Deltaproteobacteria bacterium]